MGFSVSGATAIVFLGAVIAFGSAYPAVVDSTEAISQAQGQQSDRMLEQQNAEITVVTTDYYAGNDTVTANVTNSGTTALAVADVDVLVNGSYREGATVEVVGSPGSDVWLPGETVRVKASPTSATAGDELRVKLVTGPGVSDAAEVPT
jgi:flagellar protein FlaF